MNFAKRAFVSVKRRIGKTAILLILVFILGNVIAGAISIQQAVEKTDKNIRNKLGGYVTADINYEEAYNGNKYEEVKISNIKPDQIEKIGTLPYVKYYDYVSTTTLETTELKRYVDETAAEGDYKIMPISTGTEYFIIKGVQNNEIMDLKENKSKLVQGRTFTKEEITSGKLVAVISSKLAETNKLTIGSTIKLASNVYNYGDLVRMDSTALTQEAAYNPTISATKEYAFEVIGIFETQKTIKKDDSGNIIFDYADQETQNQIYTNNKIVQDVQKFQREEYIKQYPEAAAEDYDSEFYTPIFVLNDPMDLEKFKEEAKEFLPQYYKFTDNIEAYSSILGPIENIRWIASIVLYVAIGATLVIISLLITLFLRDRKHEIGIYLSLGERKRNVMMQIVLEVVIVSFIGITLSLFTGNLLAGGISEKMLENQIIANETNNGGAVLYEKMAASSVGGYYGGTGYGDELTSEDLIEQYKVSLNFPTIMIFYAIGLGTILVSTIIPMIYIIRLNPKKILM